MIISEDIYTLLEEQTPFIDDYKKLKIICVLSHPIINWKWYLICFSNELKDSIYCLIDGPNGFEFGYIGYDEINSTKIKNMHFQIDDSYQNIDLLDLMSLIYYNEKRKQSVMCKN